MKNSNCFFIFCSVFLICFEQSVSTPEDSSLFESLPSSKTKINFVNRVIQRPGVNILRYMYYYNGGGVAIGDINNDGLPDIYFTSNNKAANKLYLNKGNFEFEDITVKAGVEGTCDWASGVTMADVNGDGYLDIYVSAITTIYDFKGGNQLYINNGNGTFTDKAEEYGLNIKGTITQSAFFDYDHDGDLDCFVLSQSMQSNSIVANSKVRDSRHAFFKSRLLRNELNNGEKKFTDVSIQAGIYQSGIGWGLGLAVADINNDGWDDIYVGNDFYEDDYFYVNNGNGTFTESGKKHFSCFSQNSMGNDVADYNNDGQPDVVTVDMLANEEKFLKRYSIEDELSTYNFKYITNGYHHQFVKNCLQTNNGNGKSFTENAIMSGVWATDWSWGPLFADFDNDGNKDLFVSAGIPKNLVDADFIKYRSALSKDEKDKQPLNSQDATINQMPDGFSHPFLYKGDGVLKFKDVSDAWGTKKLKGCSNGAAYADLNNDGNIDMVINCINASALILKNNAPQKNYIILSFKGAGFNTNAIGTKVYLFSKGNMQYQQLMLTRGFESSVEPRLHFGLNNENTIDSILIVWPDQKYELFKNVTTNSTIVINQSGNSKPFIYSNFFPEKKDVFEDITEKMEMHFKHTENDFLDYYSQPLLPHALSKRGPKVAIGDVNGDGLDDFFVCGAASQSGTMMVQNKDGKFVKTNTSVFKKDSLSEEVDAVFFDADNDKDLDLYVVSAGNQYTGNDPALLDKLYMNDGRGNFTKKINSLPQLFKEKSCVTVADIDNDGDVDIFVGGFADSKKYGVPQNSYLLLNNGKAIFTLAKSVFDSLGMVTAAQFADVNNDGYKDLVVAGEWMPITVFINKKGKFTKTDIPHSTGLWQTVYLQDINNDGYVDLLAGNWGHNNKFYVNKTPPLRLYAGNFDNSGNQVQLISYVDNGVEYPFFGKEQIERMLPAVKKKYLHSKDFAGVPFKEALGNFVKNTVPLEAEKLGSVIGYGNGKGNFTLNELPDDLQFAPICVFQKNKDNEFLAGGNYFDLSPYEGRYDDQAMALFKINSNKIKRMQQHNFDSIRGQVKDIKWINTVKYGKVLIVARNNEQLMFYKPTK